MTSTSPPGADVPGTILRALRVTAWASLVGNITLVVTGGAVRLTGSGLGCPTWPRCTASSLVPHAGLGIHGAIEFGNRMIAVILAVVVVANFVLAVLLRRRDRRLPQLAFAVGLSVPAQAVMGGITVLTDLNPWVVGLHFLLSPVLIALCVVFVVRVERGPWTVRAPALPGALRLLLWGLALVTLLVLATGTIVTGSGPHAGDGGSARNGLSPLSTSQLHADVVCLLVGLTIGAVVAARVLGDRDLSRWTLVTLIVQLAQGLVGAVQYATSVPIILVGFHLLGAALLAAVTARLLLGLVDLPEREPTS